MGFSYWPEYYFKHLLTFLLSLLILVLKKIFQLICMNNISEIPTKTIKNTQYTQTNYCHHLL